MASLTNIYVYEPLSAGRSIRILELFPCRDEFAPLRCHLFETPFKETEKDSTTSTFRYQALSYTWGAPVLSSALHLAGGSTMRITENLATALHRLRDYQDPVYLWVDAVCIDQGDESEKMSQIRFMDVIYKNATQVMVWLGNFGQDSLELLRDYARRNLSQTDMSSSLHQGGKLEIALVTVLSLPWFRRRWVVQEVVLNKNVRFVCGEAMILWNDFGRLVSNVLPLYKGFDIKISYYWDTLQSVAKMFELWEHFTGGKSSQGRCDIANLLDAFHFLRCREPGDYLYTIGRLAEDIQFLGEACSEISTNTRIMIYSNTRPFREFFIVFAHQLSCYGLLDWVLCQRLTRIKCDEPTWPSWVPMWMHGVLRSSSLVERIGDKNATRSRNRLVNYHAKDQSRSTGESLWTARMSHTVLPAYRYTELLRTTKGHTSSSSYIKDSVEGGVISDMSPKDNDDRLPWEIRWHSAPFLGSFDNAAQLAWLRTTFQNLVEQFKQMSENFGASGDGIHSYLEATLLEILLKTLVDPLQAVDTQIQIDMVGSTDDGLYRIANSLQYEEPLASYARVLEAVFRGRDPPCANMRELSKSVLEVLDSQSLFVAEYRSFEDRTPALPAVHVGLSSNNISKGDKLIARGNTSACDEGIRACFIFRGTIDDAADPVVDANLPEKPAGQFLRPYQFVEARQRMLTKDGRPKPQRSIRGVDDEKDELGGVDFFSGTVATRSFSGGSPRRPGYIYELLGRCLMVTSCFRDVWSHESPALRFHEPRVKEVKFYLR